MPLLRFFKNYNKNENKIETNFGADFEQIFEKKFIFESVNLGIAISISPAFFITFGRLNLEQPILGVSELRAPFTLRA